MHALATSGGKVAHCIVHCKGPVTQLIISRRGQTKRLWSSIGAVSCASALVVLATLTSAGAQISTSDSGTANLFSETAPIGPFRGAVNVTWISESKASGTRTALEHGAVVQFWDEERRSYHEVSLTERVGCPRVPSVHSDGVDVVFERHDGVRALISVPWRDEAYPLFWLTATHSEYSLDQMRSDHPKGMHADLVPVVSDDQDGDNYWLKLSMKGQTRWYGLHGRPGLGLEAVDATALTVDEERASEDDMYGSPLFGFDGTDGRHYAFHIKANYDTGCPLQNGYVVDGVSGTVVTCGHSWGAGVLLVDQTADTEGGRSFALPRPVPPEDCESSPNLRRIAELRRGG